MDGHAPVLVFGNLYVVLTTLTSVLGKGYLHTAIWSIGYSLSLLLYTLGYMYIILLHVCYL